MKKFTTRNMASVWIWCSNELSNCMESDSLGPVLLQIPLFWACFTQIWAVINSFICASCALSEQVPSHIFVIFSYSNTTMAVTSKKARRERSQFTLQFEVSYEESQRLVYLLLRRPIFRPKATRNGYMELALTILWPLASVALSNEYKKLVPFFLMDF